MKKILSFIAVILMCGCTSSNIINQENSNYIRTGVFKDSFDHEQYNYAEVGKTLTFNKHNSVNMFGGIQSSPSEKVFDFKDSYEDYWEVNYEFRW